MQTNDSHSRQLAQLRSPNGARSRIVTVKQLGYRKWAGFLPSTKAAVAFGTNHK